MYSQRCEIGTVVALLLVCAGAMAEEGTPVTSDTGASSGTAWRAAPAKPIDTTPKTAAARRLERARPSDELRLLGDFKALDLREGEALFRVDGQERTLRPGMLLKGDLIKAITPQRMVLLRPETADDKKGETLIIIGFTAPGRSRVRMYATRDWAARPPRRVE